MSGQTFTYDWIIVGAGSAGCVLAARLSENPAHRVLLLEAGGSDNRLTIAMPGALPFVYQNQALGWGYQAGPEPHLNGRCIDEKRGKVIGGSSSINAMIFNRGNPLDFDGWANNGLSDWDYAHCLPYFRRMETFEGGANDFRGGEGPLFISRCKADHRLHEAFFRAGEQAGFSMTEDHNGFRQEGLHRAQAFIHNGLRQSSARAFLHPAAGRSNLQIRPHSTVTRVLIEEGAALGVELSNKGQRQTILAEREVILCAGAINTPQLLMLSGVGDPQHLRAQGIALKAAVPAVGQNLENHPGVNLQYRTRREQDSLTAELSLFGRLKLGAQWLMTRQGPGASNFFESGAFLRTRDDVSFPNMQFEFLPLTRRLKNGRLTAIPGFQFWMDLSRPQSRGAVTLRSANPLDAPSIVFNHLSAAQDVQDMMDGIRLARRLVAQAAFDDFRGEELAPGKEVQSDTDLAAFLRTAVGTSYHPSGTCRMGTDADAVVDEQGRVKAIERLRVVDASILPRTVTANLNATVLMLAEKLADRILGKTPLEASPVSWYRA